MSFFPESLGDRFSAWRHAENLFGQDILHTLPAGQEIADHPNVTVKQQQVSNITKNIDTGKIGNLFYESGKPVDKIAEMFDLDEQTA